MAIPIILISKSWNQFAEKLRKNGYALLQAANPKLVVTEKGASDPNVITATLLCRSLTRLHAVSMLLNAGLVVEARTMVRNCLENAFWLAALAEPKERDETLRRMGDAEMFSRKQMGEYAMQLRSKHDAEENEALREALHKIKGQKGSVSPTPKELAKLGKFAGTYLFYKCTHVTRTRRFIRCHAIFPASSNTVR